MEEGIGWTRSTRAAENQNHHPDSDFPVAGNTPFVDQGKAEEDTKNSTKKERKKQIEGKKKKAISENVNQILKKRKTFAVTKYWVENHCCSVATVSSPSNQAGFGRTPPLTAAGAEEGLWPKGLPENLKWRNGSAVDFVVLGRT